MTASEKGLGPKGPTGPQSLLTAPLTEEETEILKQMYEDGTQSHIIADRLKRKHSSVNKKIKALAPYFRDRNRPQLFHGPQALSPQLEDSIFHARMSEIWEGLMILPKTRQWEDTLSTVSSEFWLDQIAQHTPKPVKSLLASHQPPDIARLESLNWSETEAAGVYAWILPPETTPAYLDKHFCLFVGSTSEYGVGLSGTRRRLLSKQSSTQADYTTKAFLKEHGFSRRGKLVTLLEVPFKDKSLQETMRVRALVRLARAVFIIWLGAVREAAKPAIKQLVPWELECIRYQGFASHMFFAFDFYEARGRRKMKNTVSLYSGNALPDHEAYRSFFSAHIMT